MTVKELFDFIKGVRPGFAFNDAQMMVWLNEIEGKVQTDIMLLDPAVGEDGTVTGLVEYDVTTDMNTELIVPFPWNKLYRYFMLMSIDLYNGEYQRYGNTFAQFNEAYEEYAAWYAQNIAPANGLAVAHGYYLTAYQFAARGGYTGTEKEFYETLGRIGSSQGSSYVNIATPEDYGAKGDGVQDDTAAFQSALNSGKAVHASNTYNVSTVTAKNVELIITGVIKGQIVVADNAFVHGGTIRQSTDDPCVIITCIDNTNGVQNGVISNCTLIPTRAGIGIEFTPTNGRLHDYTVKDIRISSCDKSLYFYLPGTGEQWITKGLIENVFCGSPNNVIFVNNQKVTRTLCSEIIFRNVYAQGWTPVPSDTTTTVPQKFLNIDHGCASLIFEDSFVYDAVRDYHFKITNTEEEAASDKTTITISGRIYADYTSAKFTDASSLGSFYFNGYFINGAERAKHIKALRAQTPTLDKYGSFCFLTYPNNPSARWPALEGSYFSGFVGRGGIYGETNIVSGLSSYNGRVSVLRSNTNLLGDASVYELASPYSGAVYTTETLPTGIRDGAKCWCSDIKMDVTYYNGSWYKPDGTSLT